MEIALAAWVAEFADIDDVVRAMAVSRHWRKVLRAQPPYQARFRREFPSDYALLSVEKDAVALVQDWHLLYIQRAQKFVHGYHLGFDLVVAADDSLEQKVLKAEASLLRWIYVTEQAELGLSKDITDVLASTMAPERLPLAEARYWQWSLALAKPIYDQLMHPAIPAACDALEDADYRRKMDDQIALLKKLYNQAVWNAKYFKVLEKPFGDLLSSDVRQIATIVPAVVKTLKMMWSSSKYYKDGIKMGGLLGRIAMALCARVGAMLSINHLLWENDFDSSIGLVESAGMMLERWHDVYEDGATAWGPFDRHVLFDRVDEVAQWCSEVRSALVILRQIKLSMIERVQEAGEPEQIEMFEAMLGAMDQGLHDRWADVVLFHDSSRQHWLDGVDFLRAASNDLLAFVHKL
ncbi:hypothetical protein ACHHYP_16702 [Achlya hypogyna]|uniref:Dynein heavy chain tail domain-containing protein n=1 Tax=Achlya hypogyna TaxID=1202772 RepID=A0A1V9Y673_ACHHY|nr:hypothetical protein ACHHYP_16702 [Achlya hypogyna]